MLAVFVNLLLAFVGFAVGYLFFERHKQSLLALLRTARLVLDYDYFLKLYREIAHRSGHEVLARTYDLPEQTEHAKTLQGKAAQTHRSICYQTLAMAKQLLKRLAFLALVPLVLALFAGKVPLVAASVILSIAAMTALDAFQALGSGKTARQRQELILQHAYSVHGRPLQRLSYNALLQPGPATTTPLSWPKLSKPRIIVPDVSAKKLKRRLKDMPSWQNAWWGADVAVSVLLVAHYWWGNALSDGALHLILLTLALVGFVQLFFVPMWLTIRLCQKLIAAEHSHRTPVHRP